MKILHVYRHPPDEVTRDLAAAVSRDREARHFPLYEPQVDYDLLLELILTHDQVISWW
jgi:hypothetical protein